MGEDNFRKMNNVLPFAQEKYVGCRRKILICSLRKIYNFLPFAQERKVGCIRKILICSSRKYTSRTLKVMVICFISKMSIYHIYNTRKI